MKPYPHQFRRAAICRRVLGLTLVELIVAMALLSLLCLACFQIVGHVNSMVSRNRELAGIYQEGSAAFSLLGEHIAQATLDTRKQFVAPNARIIGDPAPDNLDIPFRLGANSSLMFVSGSATDLGLDDYSVKTHGIFFQAPLGENAGANPSSSLSNALNEVGYFVQFNDGQAPSFLENRPRRYRLMQLRHWPNEVKVYKTLLAHPDPASPDAYDWFQSSIAAGVSIEPVANNVLALIVVPKYSSAPPDPNPIPMTGEDPSEGSYLYDSRTTALLPTALEVTIVVAGEMSIARYEAANPNTDFDFGQFTAFNSSPQEVKERLDTLRQNLNDNQIAHRVFSATFNMRSAEPWAP